MKIATWNVNSLSVRLPQVLAWLAEQSPDVLALQELKLTGDKFPHEAFSQIGYSHTAVLGQKTYNGVALISRYPLSEVQLGNPHFADEQARLIAATVNGARIINGYFVNGQDPESDKFQYKLQWLEGLHDWLGREMAQYPQLALMGDFNITADDRDSCDPEGLRDTIHHTRIERTHFQRLLDAGLFDAFRHFETGEKHYSWWDYREMAFRRNRGLRIDYVLLSAALRASLTACTIDKKPRKNERPSDHTPVIAQWQVAA